MDSAPPRCGALRISDGARQSVDLAGLIELTAR
jgi:hypothetical protein